MRYVIRIFVVATFVTLSARPVNAGLGSLLRKGFSKLAQRGTSSAARKSGSTAVKTGAKTAGRVGSQAGSTVVHTGGRLASRAGQKVVTRLGPAGQSAVAKWSPRRAEMLAEISEDLSRNPYCDEWLSYIARAGDAALDVAWRNKGGIAVLSVATAMAQGLVDTPTPTHWFGR